MVCWLKKSHPKIYTMKKIFQQIIMSVTIAALFSVHPVHAQQIEKMKYDSNYIRTYPEKFGLRILASQNYASLNLPSAVDGHDIHYHANRKLNLGIGGAYKNISLNLTIGVGYLNNKDIGKTKGLDFQFHFTPYKWEVDLLTSFHRAIICPLKDTYLQIPGSTIIDQM